MTSVNLMKLVVVATALAVAGCGGEGGGIPGVEAAAKRGEEEVLRAQHDAARGRFWVLGLDGARVYETGGKRLIRHVALPEWSVARFVCNPGFTLDKAGTAIMASNVQPRLWLVDGSSFQVREITVTLEGRERWETGFGALAHAADGSLLALTANGNSLWKIDLAGARASLVESYHLPLKSCSIPAQGRG